MTDINVDQSLALVLAPGSPSVAADQSLAFIVEQRLIPATINTYVDQIVGLIIEQRLPTTSATLIFQDPAGNPLANGYVIFRLNTDAQVGGRQILANRTVQVPLDPNGFVSFQIWANSQLTPANTVYFVNAYSEVGELAWSGEMTF